LWQYLATHSFDRQIDKAERSPLALTVRFCQPNDGIVHKYSLSNEQLLVSGRERE